MKFAFVIVALVLAACETAASQPCAAGRFMGESGECVDCPLGFYQPLPAQNGCLKCPETSYTAATGSTSCEDCLENQVSNDNKDGCVCKPGFKPGSVGDRVPISCEACAPGSYLFTAVHIGIYLCMECRANTFSSERAQAECKPCPPGQFAPKGSERCYSCEEGEVFSQGRCMKCAVGFEYDEPSGECRACRPGFYKRVEGSFPCLPCPQFMVANEGGTECVRPCAAGEVLISSNVQGDDVRCRKCAAGSYLDTSYTPPICSQCSENQFMPYENTRPTCFRCAGDEVSAPPRGATGCVCRQAAVNGSCSVCEPFGQLY